MSDFIEAKLRDRLGETFDFETLCHPERGTRSDLLLVRRTSGPGVVVRFFKNRARGVQVEKASTLARASGVPVPELILADNSRAHFLRHGFGVIVERLIEGEHPEAGALDRDKLGALGTALARLHAIERERWGRPGQIGLGSYFKKVILARVSNRLDSLKRFDPEYDPAWRSRMMRIMKEAGKSWDAGPPFALTHDKINPGNLIADREGNVFFLDVETLQFGAAGKDLSAAFYYFCGSDSDEEIFKEAYFAGLRPFHREHFARFEPLYRSWHHLSRWAAKTRAYEKGKKRDGVAPDEDVETYLTRTDDRAATWRWLEILEENLRH